MGSQDLRRRVARRLVPRPPDAPRQWKGTAGDHPRRVNVLRYGDCAWRECDYGHNLGRRPGYPQVLADLLARRAVGMGWSWVYMARHQDLPQTEEDLVRFVRLDGDPDLVVLQLSTGHAVRTIWPIRPLWNDARIHLAQRSGPLSLPVYWVMHRVLRAFGRPHSTFPGTDALETFWALVARRWPHAQRVMLGPLCRAYVDGFIDVERLDEIWGEVARCSLECGVTVVDSIPAMDALRDRIGRRALNGFNGYDLRRPGHEVIAAQLLDVVDRAAADAGPAAAEATHAT